MTSINSQTASVDYLSLLSVQLQNQDPIDPVDQEGLINDLTQFSMLEGIENLNASFEQVLKVQQLDQGAGLVGKQVNFTDQDSGELRTGEIQEMFLDSDEINFLVDGERISIDQVLSVSLA